MRLLAFLVFVLVTGCVENGHNHRMNGIFRSESGEAVMIAPDQRVYVAHDEGIKAEDMVWLGSIVVDRKAPREAFLITTSTSPWIGSMFVFDADYKTLAVYQPRRRLGERPEAKKHFERVR